MTELTLDQALKKGVEAHKAGKLQEADRYYTAILKAQPKHPDANHNIGVLAVGLGKVQEALPFFKTALEANPSIAQFWLSYMDALIKIDLLEDAKTLLKKVRSKDMKHEGFDKFEEKIFKLTQNEVDQHDDKLIDKSIKLRESGKYDEAIDLLKGNFSSLSNDPNLLSIISHCHILNDNLEEAIICLEKAKSINPKIASIGWNETRILLKQKKVDEALVIAKKTNKLFPDDVEGMGVLGSCLRLHGDIDVSLKFLNKAIKINPNYAEAYINRGLISLIQKKKIKCLSDLEKAHQLKPHIRDIWHLVLDLKMDLKQFEDIFNTSRSMLKIDPNDAKIYAKIAFSYQILQKFEKAVLSYKKAININPNYAEAYINMGIALKKQGKFGEAIESFNKALEIKHDYAEAYINIGNALKDQNKFEEAIETYNKALEIKPDYVEAYLNIGISLRNQGKLEEAVDAYRKALEIKHDYAEAYVNMGVIFNKQSKLEKALEASNKALKIKPNYAEAYLNIGNALNSQGKLKEAIEAYKKAILIKPHYAEPYWNLYGSSENIEEAKKWIEQCLKADPNHLMAKFTLPALKFYKGNKSDLRALVKSPLKDNPFVRSFIWAFSLPKLPPLYFHRWALFDQMIKLSKKNRPFYEFGVWRGEAFKYLIKTFKKGYGFDTFEGIPENWHTEKAGTYSSEGNIPRIDGGEFIVGKFEDTLPDFFSQKRPMASIINFDADLYSSTICALNFSKPVIDKHTILIFDEFLMNNNWEQDEYKALEEFCAKNQFTYEVLAISFFNKQVALRLKGIQT